MPNPTPSRAHSFLAEHRGLTRRYFLRLGAAGTAAAGLWPTAAHAEPAESVVGRPELAERSPSWSPFSRPRTNSAMSRAASRCRTRCRRRRNARSAWRETWKLEVVSDPDHPAKLGRQFTKGTARRSISPALLKLAEKHAVRFAKVMTCLNIGCPLGMGIWEGVPLREVVWLTQPRENLRRVFYYGYHNDDPKQMFRSSLPIGRVLEDPFDLPPVILCYKLNGQWLDGERGGPVRIVVPEAYGFKSIKWLTHVVLTNLASRQRHLRRRQQRRRQPAEDVSPRRSRVPNEIKAGEPIPVTGYAQVGISGLSKVQVWIQPTAPSGPPTTRISPPRPWTDAQILPPPKHWGGELAGRTKFPRTRSASTPPASHAVADASGQSHWAALLPGLPAGDYTLRCRPIRRKKESPSRCRAPFANPATRRLSR